MPKKLTTKEVQEKINKKYNYIIVQKKISPGKYEFKDKEYGIFVGYLNHLLNGKCCHNKRKKNLKNASFEERARRVNDKFKYIELIEYNEKKLSSFYDKNFGSFYGNFKDVYAGKKIHPERTKLNRKKAITKEVKEKRKQTCLKKYGTENPQQNKEIKEKTNKTVYEKYGVKNVSQNNNLNIKRKKTFKLKYGFNNPGQSSAIKNKIKKTFIKKYGKNPLSCKEIQNKVKKTMLQKYGVEHPMHSKYIKNKMKKSNIDNNNFYNIKGDSLRNYFYNSNLPNKIAYTTCQQNVKKYGNKALSIDFYKNNRYSKTSEKWFKKIEQKLNILLIKEYHISKTLYHADGYDPKTNTVYEFLGSYYHGDPIKYKSTDYNKKLKKTFGQLYKNTINREIKIRKLGYSYQFIWESDFKNE